MNLKTGIIILGPALLLGCGLLSSVLPPATPVPPPPPPPAAPTIAELPTTPSQPGQPAQGQQGPITRQVNVPIGDLRFGQSGNTCEVVAGDLSNQSVAGTLTTDPNLEQNSLTAEMNDGTYRGTVALLNSQCAPIGTQYNLTANFTASYQAVLGKTGGQYCINRSNASVKVTGLQGLPSPLNALAMSLIPTDLDQQVKPHLDRVVVEQLNNGQVPASGVDCP